MLKCNVMAVKADKQNGYAIEDRHTTIKVHEDILGFESYSEVAPCSMTRSSIVDGYCKLCKRVANYEKIVNLCSMLTRTLGGDIAVKLQLTRTSHKPCGKVSHRNLHCGPKWACNGLACWAEVVLNGYLKPIRHIVESTAEFVQRLRGVKPHIDAFMVRTDVSDFYMIGDVVSVASDASAIIPGKE